MPFGGFLIVGCFGILLTTLVVVHCVQRRSWGKLVIAVACAVLYFAAIVHFIGLPDGLGEPTSWAKGAENRNGFYAAVAVLTVCIVLGMVAEVLYSWLDNSSAKRKQFDWPSVIKPILISPLVLVPTIAAFQNAQIDLTSLGFPWLMMMLTAFEKGFLWRYYMKKRYGR